MSMHEELTRALHQEIDNLDSAIVLSPATLAIAVQRKFANQKTMEPHIQYASLEHIKQMARTLMARRFDPDAEESASYQGQLFSGTLQEYYPVKLGKSQAPVYKKREALTHLEVQWNVTQLRKSARARLEHADALQAWADRRYRMAA